MKFNRRQLRRMILNEIKNLTESDREYRMRSMMGDDAYERHMDAQNPLLDRYREGHNVIEGIDPQTGSPFKIEVDGNQEYGMRAANGEYGYSNPHFAKRIPAAIAIYPRVYTLAMAFDQNL